MSASETEAIWPPLVNKEETTLKKPNGLIMPSHALTSMRKVKQISEKKRQQQRKFFIFLFVCLFLRVYFFSVAKGH